MELFGAVAAKTVADSRQGVGSDVRCSARSRWTRRLARVRRRGHPLVLTEPGSPASRCSARSRAALRALPRPRRPPAEREPRRPLNVLKGALRTFNVRSPFRTPAQRWASRSPRRPSGGRPGSSRLRGSTPCCGLLSASARQIVRRSVQLAAQVVPRCHLAHSQPQRGSSRAMNSVSAWSGPPASCPPQGRCVPVVLRLLREQDQRGRVGRLRGERQVEQDERVRVPLQGEPTGSARSTRSPAASARTGTCRCP